MGLKAEHPRAYYEHRDIMSRCYNKRNKNYKDYGGRGIKVCAEWHDRTVFCAWAVEHGIEKGLQLDRIDNNGDYCPENCHYVTPKQNSNNRRNTWRLEDGTPLALFCESVGIHTTCGDGSQSKQYARILFMYRKHHKPHPELIAKATEYLTLLRQLKASLILLEEARELRRVLCNGLQMISLPET